MSQMHSRYKFALVFALLCAVLIAGLHAATGIIEGKYNRVRIRPPYEVPAAAADLHNTLFVADLHCDSLLWGRNLLKQSTTGHVDIPRLKRAHVSLQAFTVVTTVPRKLNIERNSSSTDMVRYLAIAEGWPPRTWSSPKERALYQARRLQNFEAESNGE